MIKNSYTEKNIELSIEFSKYCLDHPELENKIPDGAEVIMLLENNEEFNKESLKLAEKVKSEGQPVVFVKAQGLAPAIASRLINPVIESVV
jgi:hypothetical protein